MYEEDEDKAEQEEKKIELTDFQKDLDKNILPTEKKALQYNPN